MIRVFVGDLVERAAIEGINVGIRVRHQIIDAPANTGSVHGNACGSTCSGNE